MCRNIRPLYNFEPPATEDEIHQAALQFIRKITGYNKPSKVNTDAFNQAVEQLEEVIGRLFNSLQTKATPRNRDKELKKAKKRFEERMDRLRKS